MLPRRAAARLVATLALGVAAGCGDGGSPAGEAAAARRSQARDLAGRAGLAPHVADFLARAAEGAAATYRVTYDVDDGSTVTIVSDPPERRVDVTADEAGAPEPVTRSVIATRDGTYQCREGHDRWFCAEAEDEAVEVGPFGDADLARAANELAATSDSYELSVDERRVGGADATCLVARPVGTGYGQPGAVATLCVSAEGVPLLVARPSGTIRATAYSTTVAPDAFDLPAEPAGEGSGPPATTSGP